MANVNLDLITLDDISETLGFCYRHTRERITKRADFPKAIKIGRTRQWHKKEFEAWLGRQREH
ncbi:MAG: hypothetical protein COB23_02975 [Methylophaga sp.]|nr:MAG: hypothetical protein COB23_02975 [Methylophaga sp.]